VRDYRLIPFYEEYIGILPWLSAGFVALIVKYIRHYVKHTIQSGDWYHSTRDVQTGEHKKYWAVLPHRTIRKESMKAFPPIPGIPLRAPEKLVIPELQMDEGARKGGASIRFSARAMIGFQYTPITITYSDCNSEHF
jgi:hypothetical protein